MKQLFTALILALGVLPVAHANDLLGCTIRTFNGNYLTAVNSGGVAIVDSLHSDATKFGAWEKFRLDDTGKKDGSLTRYGIKTADGTHFLTAVSGGGRTSEAIHSDATKISSWEEFKFVPYGGNVYAIQTTKGLYLTAVGGGGRTTNVIHSDASIVSNREKFTVVCGY